MTLAPTSSCAHHAVPPRPSPTCVRPLAGFLWAFPRPPQVWAVPTTHMQCEWLGERVATVDVDRAIHNVIMDREDAGWGPNAVFRFPTKGGTGAIWKGVAALLPQEKQVRGVRCSAVFALV